jgi:NAD-dependent dihydropyrimidine dehydrogenase PreA subunit
MFLRRERFLHCPVYRGYDHVSYIIRVVAGFADCLSECPVYVEKFSNGKSPHLHRLRISFVLNPSDKFYIFSHKSGLFDVVNHEICYLSDRVCLIRDMLW